MPVTVACRVLKIARQPYYRWKTSPVADATWVAAHRIERAWSMRTVKTRSSGIGSWPVKPAGRVGR